MSQASAPAASGQPLPQHLRIVALETFFTPLPPLIVPAPHTFSLTEYERTTAAEVGARIADADIVISTVVPIRQDVLAVAQTPRLRLIAVMASGTDSVDLAACAARGIRVLNSPHCNTAALAEHVAALYLSLRRSLLPVMRGLCGGAWTAAGSLMRAASASSGTGAPPRSCRDETVALVGYGGVGQAVERILGTGLGMTIIVGGRRGQPADEVPGGRVPFDDALARASVVVVCCPRTPDTLGLIGARELALLPRDAILINVARGGIVEEAALVAALRAGALGGAGVDVFDVEPATPQTSPVVAAAATGELNLVATGHTAWIAASTTANYQRVVQENVEQFIRGTVTAERIKA